MRIKVGDRVVYWYNIGRPGVVVDFVKSPDHGVWLEGGAPATPVRAVVKHDDGEILTYSISELRHDE